MKYNKIYFSKIDSTNNYALSNISKLYDKTIIYAEEQTAGKGRNSRIWISNQKSNLYCTIIVKPELKNLKYVPNITQYMAVVLCRVFEKYKISPKIKWPNDILIDGKKISGILCETSFKGSMLEGVCIGFGVNLNIPEYALKKIDQPATSLNILLGHYIDRNIFLDALLDEFFENYDVFIQTGFLRIRDEYKNKLVSLNKEIKINVFDYVYCGILKDIDQDGQLILLQQNSNEIPINIGDVII